MMLTLAMRTDACPVLVGLHGSATSRFPHNKGNYNGITSRCTDLRVRPCFSNPGIGHDPVHPYDEVEWETRVAEIKNHATGEPLFRQEGVEFPAHFSQLATNIIASKYFYGDVKDGNGSPKDGKREYSLAQPIDRVVDTITMAGVDQGILDEESAHHFAMELKWLLVNQYGAFNSPVWFNVGLNAQYGITDKGGKTLFGTVKHRVAEGGTDVPTTNERDVWLVEEVDPYERPQSSACFIIGLEDSVEGIWELMQESARLFKYGSGVGADWSVLRSTKDALSGGGQPSGPVSFMRVQDSTGGTIKSGGPSTAGR